MNDLLAPRHIVGVRTAEAKLGVYSHWLPGTTKPIIATTELEFYDYATPEGRAETVSTPDDPRAKAMLEALLRRYVPDEMEKPLPPSLRAAQGVARASYLAYVALADLYVALQLVDQGQLATTFGFGGPF